MPGGNELVYRTTTGEMMAVKYRVEEGRFVPELPQKLFDTPTPPYGFMFDVSADGRFLAYRDKLDQAASEREPVVVVNWHHELEGKVPR